MRKQKYYKSKSIPRYQYKSSTWNPLERKLWKEYFKLQYWNCKARKSIIEKWYSKVLLYVPEQALFAR